MNLKTKALILLLFFKPKAFVSSRSMGRVRGAQLPDAAKDGVRRACAQGGMKREMGHQVACHVFDTVTSAEVHAHQRAYYLAVLVSISGAPKPQLAVNNRADVTVK